MQSEEENMNFIGIIVDRGFGGENWLQKLPGYIFFLILLTMMLSFFWLATTTNNDDIVLQLTNWTKKKRTN